MYKSFMRKSLLTTSLIFTMVVPHLAFASWWNPATWFESPLKTDHAVSTPDSTSQLQQQLIVVTSSSTNESNTEDIQTASKSKDDSVSNEPALQAKVDSLNAKINSLELQLNRSNDKLSSLQNSYAICQSGLSKAQDSLLNYKNKTENSSSITPTETIKPNSASISLNHNTPRTSSVLATNGQYLGLPVLIFDIHPSSDGQVVKSITLNVNTSGQGTINTLKLYSGYSYPLSTALVSDGVAEFSDIASVPPLSTKSSPYNTFHIQADITGLKDIGSAKSISLSVSDIKVVDSSGNIVDISGTVQGNIITVTE